MHSKKKLIVLALTLAQVTLIGWVDYLTSYEISLAVLYYGPIAYATWQLGWRWSFAIGLLCALTVTWAEWAGGFQTSSGWILAERFLMRAIGFGFVAFSFNYFKQTRERDRQRIRELEEMLTFCSCCHKVRDEAGDWVDFDSFLRDNPAAQHRARLCPICARATYAERTLR